MLTVRNKIRLGIILVFVVALLAGFLDFPNQFPGYIQSAWNGSIGQFTTENGRKPLSWEELPSFRLGLDLQGGTHLIYEADISEVPGTEQTSALEGVRDVIERRVNAFGVSEPLVQTSRSGDNWRIVVELAGISDVNQAINMIGETPLLEFKKLADPKPTELIDEQKVEIEEYNKIAIEAAEEILAKTLEPDADFAALAQQYSEDPGSADNGGSIGWMEPGKLVLEYEEAIFDQLTVGEITDSIVETAYGYHIIKKEDQKGGLQPDGTDDTQVLSSHILILKKSELDYAVPQEEWEYTGLTGKQLNKAVVQFDPNTNVPEVSLEFNDEGKELFADITEQNIGKVIGIFLDGEPISLPRVNEAIPSGKAVISGAFDIKEAKLLAQRLNAGALPVPINLISQETIGASLGSLSVEKSLRAGLIGLVLIGLFMLLYYRLPGLLADLSLIFYGLVILALFKLIPVTLTLSGIAGFILSLGMAVDANVLVFERLKEELKKGKTLGAAIEDGFIRAWPSIRDGNISTLITCLILMWFSTSLVKGFAITLGIGILVSMFSAMVVTKLLLRFLSQNKFANKIWLYGVNIKRQVLDS